MATIDNLSVELAERHEATQSAVLRIRYRLRFSDLERDIKGLRFREKIQLFGAYCLGGGDCLFELETKTFAVSRESSVERERLATVCDDFIDEAEEAVHAKVWVTPRLPEACFEESPPMVLSF